MRIVAPFLALLQTAVPSSAAAQDVPPDLLVTLERTSCFGECHVYTVSIDARGNVNYEGKEFVRVTGRAADRMPVSRLRDLLATIDRIGFFDLREQYRVIRNPDGTETVVTDLPTTFVSVTRDGKTKRVEDYVAAPDGLRELERQIDAAANTRRWTRIDESTLRQLVFGGRMLSPLEREEMFSNALSYDDVDVVRTLLEMGIDPNVPLGPGRVLPITLVRSAAAARVLLAGGASPVARDERGETALGRAARLEPELTAVLLRAGVPADIQVNLVGVTALIYAADAGNIDVVKLLLAAGANPSHRGPNGSALDAARNGKSSESRRFPSLWVPRFRKDFDAVIAVLEAALSKKP